MMRAFLGLVLMSFSFLNAEDDGFAARQNAALTPGINLSGYFEGDTARRVQKADILRIKEQGFRSVRLPVCWTKHIDGDKIEARFLASVKEAVDFCMAEDLRVMLDVHHFNQMNDEPDRYEDFLVALWQMLTVEFKSYDQRLLFELLNEPQNKLDVKRWNQTVSRLHTEIRKLDPSRTLVIGGAEFNGWWTLGRLELPEEDRNIIVTVHYYTPMEFTHQGAHWLPDRKGDRPTAWTNREKMAEDFTKINQYAKRTGRPINIGEFGVYRQIASAGEVAKWVGAVTMLCKEAGFSFHYWEYNSGFGLYRKGRWDREITDLLVK